MQPLALALALSVPLGEQPSQRGRRWSSKSRPQWRQPWFSQLHGARQGDGRGGLRELQTGNQSWALGLSVPPLFLGPGPVPCFPRVILTKWRLLCPETESGDKSFRDKVKGITYSEGLCDPEGLCASVLRFMEEAPPRCGPRLLLSLASDFAFLPSPMS